MIRDSVESWEMVQPVAGAADSVLNRARSRRIAIASSTAIPASSGLDLAIPVVPLETEQIACVLYLNRMAEVK